MNVNFLAKMALPGVIKDLPDIQALAALEAPAMAAITFAVERAYADLKNHHLLGVPFTAFITKEELHDFIVKEIGYIEHKPEPVVEPAPAPVTRKPETTPKERTE